MKQRLQIYYQDQVVPQICQKFGYKNIHEVPRLEKIVINRGLGGNAQNAKILESLLFELTIIAAQQGVLTRARKAIAGFKIRKATPVGIIVTLRGERIYAFLDRLINLALPRIRDFQGVNQESFDGRGNYSLGVEEQLIFPEIQYEKIDHLNGMNFSIVTSSNTDKERLDLLKILGIPF